MRSQSQHLPPSRSRQSHAFIGAESQRRFDRLAGRKARPTWRGQCPLRILATVFLLCIHAQCAYGQDPMVTERLIIPRLPGWMIIQTSHPSQADRFIVWAPSWKVNTRPYERLMVQHLADLRNLSPSRFAHEHVRAYQALCKQVRATSLPQPMLQRRPTLRLFIASHQCRRQPDHNQILLILQGYTALYVVRYIWPEASFSSTEFHVANHVLDQVTLCRPTEEKCPD